MTTAYRNPGHFANAVLQKERRAVTTGRASWTFARPAATMQVHPEMASGPPTRPVRVPLDPPRRPFGEGLGERNPVHRSPVSLSDMAWWAEEARREADREIDRRAVEAEFAARYDGWY